MYFEEIAIIGRSCLLPGALNPEELWNAVISDRDLLIDTPDNYWRVDQELVMADSPKTALPTQTWTKKGGYVRGFELVFKPDGFNIPAEEIMKFDPMVHWLLHTGREALKDAGYKNYESKDSKAQIGAIFGNLSYPSHSLNEFAESIWLESQGENFLKGNARKLAKVPKPHPINRFMSGLPAHILAKALKLNAGAFALDAACASSLYAIKLACDLLHDRKTDIMLAGGINRADDLNIHVGFCNLMAMSQTGRSRPFHKDADGLVPAEGAGFVVLKRLQDAIDNNDRVLGVIRAVGVSNDGRGHGMLVPSQEGQERALKMAYEMSGLKPADISMIECHATGTPVGDIIEIRTMNNIYKGLEKIPIGTIKSNIGHSITVSGIAGLIKVLFAMKEKIRPATLHVEEPMEILKDSPLRLLNNQEAWKCDGPRIAAINNFGFGGNNAHLIVEEWNEALYKKKSSVTSHKKVASTNKPSIKESEIAIVGIGVMAADIEGSHEFAKTLFSGKSRVRKRSDGTLSAFTESFNLPLKGLKFPPIDLKQTLPQQLMVLKAAMEAVEESGKLVRDKTGVMIGMQCDAEAARYGASCRISQWAKEWGKEIKHVDIDKWVSTTKEKINPLLKAAAVVGAMPNIVTNRICSQFDLGGPSFSLSSEELSGIRCMNIGIRNLKKGELDAVVVGSVDMCCEEVHESAAKEVLDKNKHISGDAAVVMVLKRVEDARKDGNKIYAIISNKIENDTHLKIGTDSDAVNLNHIFGHSHTASGLLHVAAAAMACHYRIAPEKTGIAIPWLFSQKSNKDKRTSNVTIDALGGQSDSIIIKENIKTLSPKLVLEDIPNFYIYSGADKEDVLLNLKNSKEGDEGPARLVIVSTHKDFEKKKNQALDILENNRSKKENTDNYINEQYGIYFKNKPIQGEVAFVFSGSAGVYPGMGRDLLFAFPEIRDGICKHFPSIKESIGWIYEQKSKDILSPEQMLWGSSFLSQLHAGISQEFFCIKPEAVIGYSSGESNSLFAMRAWRDMDSMMKEFQNMGVFTKELGGEFNTIKKAWEDKDISKISWINWWVMADEGEVLKIIKPEPLVHITIINAPGDIIISGESDACDRVIKKLGKHRAYKLAYNMANHCPEVELYAKPWHKLHHRKTYPVKDVRFYTSSTCSHYQPTSDKAADALLGMGTKTLNFPLMIENAYNDGVRIFLEHGPLNSCSKWIQKTLSGKDHIAISMDKGGKSSLIQTIHAMAQLLVSGVPVQYKSFMNKLSSTNIERGDTTVQIKNDNKKSAQITYQAHPPKVQLPPFLPENEPEIVTTYNENENFGIFDQKENNEKLEMNEAPTIPWATEESVSEIEKPKETITIKPDKDRRKVYNTNNNIITNITEQNRIISSIHQDFLEKQSVLLKRFLEVRRNAISLLKNAYTASPTIRTQMDTSLDYTPTEQVTVAETSPTKDKPVPSVQPIFKQPYVAEKPIPSPLHTQQKISSEKPLHTEKEKPHIKPATEQEITAEDIKKAIKEKKSIAKLLEKMPTEKHPLPDEVIAKVFTHSPSRKPVGPSFDRDQLKVLASGKISSVFGPLFEKQDKYKVQVRLPESPLLLVDRITGIDAEPGVLGKGVIWTETDVSNYKEYLYGGYLPGGLTIEAGQSDLTLISWMGIDFFNKGERAYRLLGTELCYYGSPPKDGETLCYEIHIDGHAKVGGVRLFFFHYDCRINGELRLSVRNAQAGFFTKEELALSGGVLWDAETAEHKPENEVRLDKPAVICTKNKFSEEDLIALSERRVYDCFGHGFEWAQTHTKSAGISSGKMRLIDRVTNFEINGGPWKRGYLRAEQDVAPDAWFLTCHFKDDPCMPGTLMSDGCGQAMAFFMIGLGYTLKRDGWRFDPVPNQSSKVQCRGQVTTDIKDPVVYEIFIEEIIDGPYPTIYADILGSLGGLKIFHGRRLGLRLVPDWPLEERKDIFENYTETKEVAKFGDFKFDYKAMLAGAWGKPSDAFGSMGKLFDDTRYIARLPGPPYHFMSRITHIDGEIAGRTKNSVVESEYDIPENVWYFKENGYPTMPLCIIMEVALQPCGWLSVYNGFPAESDEDLYYRNLDGTAKIHAEILPGSGTIRTRAKLISISRIAGVILVSFDAECFQGEKLVYSMKTGFGFFPKTALDAQTGIPASEEDRKALEEPSDFFVDLKKRPEQYCGKSLRLPGKMLLMLDRITGFWPNGGKKGLGRLRAEKTVDISEWFFKAHFFQDPVQPGSIGVEATIQMLQFYMIHVNMDKGIENPRFEPIKLEEEISWKYRGQVTPKNKLIRMEMDILEKGRDEKGPYAIAEAWYWKESMRIYQVKRYGIRIVSGESSEKPPKKALAEMAKKDDSTDNIAIEKLTAKLGIDPSTAHVSGGGKTITCDSMPLTLYPISTRQNKSGNPSVIINKPYADLDRIFSYGHKLFNTKDTIYEDFNRGFFKQFVGNMILEDPEDFKKLKEKSVLYLANHQVQFETLPIFMLLQTLTNVITLTIGNASHKKGWLGALSEKLNLYPGISYPKALLYFDQKDRASLFGHMNKVKNEIQERGTSLFMHTEGKLGLSCRKPVKKLSSVFMDFALDINLPIVPVRFVGGLPIEDMESTLDFPIGYTKQDYYIGRSIMPETLKNIPYADRSKLVIKAINELGSPLEEEIPNPPDHNFAKRVKEWMIKKDTFEVSAVLCAATEKLGNSITDDTKKLLKGLWSGKIEVTNDAKGKWIAEMSEWLSGKSTIDIVYKN